jgi:two-component system cell cycle response regulator
MRATGGSQPTPAKTARVPARGATVLVLDDSQINLQFKRDLLQPHGYTVVTADTPTQALRLARAHLPALILSDVGMSEGSGFDFIRAVKADPLLRDIPFIFLSSTHWNEASRTLGLQLGAFRYLLRPLEPAVLLAEIEGCLSQH